MTNPRLLVGRYPISGKFHHIVTCTVNHWPIFGDFNNARILVLTMRELEFECAAHTFCFVIMPDHAHWVIQPLPDQSLGNVVKLLKGRSARRINQERNTCGTLWQGGYFERTIKSSDDLLRTGQYIVENPVRAGLVSDLGQYPHWDGVWLRDLNDGWAARGSTNEVEMTGLKGVSD